SRCVVQLDGRGQASKQPGVTIAPDPATDSEIGLKQRLLADAASLAEWDRAESVRVSRRLRLQVRSKLLRECVVVLVERYIHFEEALREKPVVRCGQCCKKRRGRKNLVFDFKSPQPLHGREEVYVEWARIRIGEVVVISHAESHVRPRGKAEIGS